MSHDKERAIISCLRVHPLPTSSAPADSPGTEEPTVSHRMPSPGISPWQEGESCAQHSGVPEVPVSVGGVFRTGFRRPWVSQHGPVEGARHWGLHLSAPSQAQQQLQALQVGPRTPLKLFCLPDKHPGPGGGHDHAPLPRPLLQHTLWAEPKDGLQSGDVPSGKVSPGDPPQPSHTPARRMSHMGGTVPCPKQPRGTEAVGVVQHLPGQPAQQTHFSCILSLSITLWRSRSVTQGIVSAWL